MHQEEDLTLGWFPLREEAEYLYDVVVAIMTPLPIFPTSSDLTLERQGQLRDYAQSLLQKVMPQQPER